MDKEVRKQILKVRDTGLTNMFNLCLVKKIASEMELSELIVFIEEHSEEYIRFILTGK